MCGRFALTATPQHIAAHFDVPDMPPLLARYNIAPSTAIAVIRQQAERRHCDLLRWGLVPAWSREPATKYSTINARAETVAEKPAYRAAFRARRCLVPASGFYEWQQQAGPRQPFYICRRDRDVFAFAGLWERWERGDEVLESCSIIVTTANALMQPIHARMPVILPPGHYAQWLDPQASTAALQALLVPCDSALLQAIPVSTRVNNPRHDSADCQAPADTS
jgi:putative SOS response-associated peptidase YedK